MINLMLDDGLPYHIIIEELGETLQRAQPRNLVKWVQGGYEDYLKNRQTIEGAKTQAEFAADLVRELGNIAPSVVYRACLHIAALQMLNAIWEYGDETLRQMLQVRPASYLTMLNTVCNVSNAEIERDEQGQTAG